MATLRGVIMTPGRHAATVSGKQIELFLALDLPRLEIVHLLPRSVAILIAVRSIARVNQGSVVLHASRLVPRERSAQRGGDAQTGPRGSDPAGAGIQRQGDRVHQS